MSEDKTQNKRNKYLAAAFALFLGPLGVHKFYLHKSQQGLLYLMISLLTLGIGGIVLVFVSWFEGISYLLMSKSEFDGRYNRMDFLVT